jgi:hypothetical protein
MLANARILSVLPPRTLAGSGADSAFDLIEVLGAVDRPR